MIKLIRSIGRGKDSGLSHEDFIRHHGSEHLVLFEQCPGFLMRTRGYSQNFIVVDEAQLAALPIPGLLADHDSIIEVWWDSVAELEASLADPTYLEMVRPDEVSIGDLVGLRDVVTREVEIMTRLTVDGCVKLYRFIKRKPGFDAAQFSEYWRTVYASRLTAVPALHRRTQRYVQNHGVPLDHDPTPTMTDYDCVDEFWFNGLDDVAALYAEAAWREALASSAEVLADPHEIPSVIAVERPAASQWLIDTQARLRQIPEIRRQFGDRPVS